jgi:hypothetical protein
MQTINNNNKGWGFGVVSLIILMLVMYSGYTKAGEYLVVKTGHNPLLVISSASFSINYGINTTHLDGNGCNTSHDCYNEDNGIIALEYNFEDSRWGMILATFENSHFNKTTAIGMSYDFYDAGWVNFELLGGVMKGYTAADIGDVYCDIGKEDICWFVAPRMNVPVYSYRSFKVKVSALVLNTAVITTVGLEYKF